MYHFGHCNVPRRTIDTDINFVREYTGNVWICILILSRANNGAIMMGGGLFLDPFSEHRCIGRYTKQGSSLNSDLN